MTDTDKIVAAIFTAGMCGKKNSDHAAYLQNYNTFLELMEKERAAKKKPMKINKGILDRPINVFER
jgi:hypothetical protein